MEVFAEYPNRNKLRSLGFKTKEQQDAVLKMLGMKTSIYKAGDDSEKIPVLESVFSCDVFDAVENLRDT